MVARIRNNNPNESLRRAMRSNFLLRKLKISLESHPVQNTVVSPCINHRSCVIRGLFASVIPPIGNNLDGPGIERAARLLGHGGHHPFFTQPGPRADKLPRMAYR